MISLNRDCPLEIRGISKKANTPAGGLSSIDLIGPDFILRLYIPKN